MKQFASSVRHCWTSLRMWELTSVLDRWILSLGIVQTLGRIIWYWRGPGQAFPVSLPSAWRRGRRRTGSGILCQSTKLPVTPLCNALTDTNAQILFAALSSPAASCSSEKLPLLMNCRENEPWHKKQMLILMPPLLPSRCDGTPSSIARL